MDFASPSSKNIANPEFAGIRDKSFHQHEITLPGNYRHLSLSAKVAGQARNMTMKSETEPTAYGVSVKEASRLLGIGRTKTYELLKARALRKRKIGSRTVVSVASILEFLERDDPDIWSR
jgi:excisionase family DNA binding protein